MREVIVAMMNWLARPFPSTNAVVLSIFAHGLSASPGIEWYARKIAALPADAPENQSVG